MNSYDYVQPISTFVYFLIGVLIGIAAVTITAVLVILCASKHKNVVTNENGFKIQTQRNCRPIEFDRIEDRRNRCRPIAEMCPTSNPNTYVSKEMMASVPPSSTPQNKPPTSQQRRASISSDYTESHYYTEIDEYFINKRKVKELKKLQRGYDNKAFEEHPVATNVLQLDNSPCEYDYAYGLSPQK